MLVPLVLPQLKAAAGLMTLGRIGLINRAISERLVGSNFPPQQGF
jgi:hypothetical protein